MRRNDAVMRLRMGGAQSLLHLFFLYYWDIVGTAQKKEIRKVLGIVVALKKVVH